LRLFVVFAIILCATSASGEWSKIKIARELVFTAALVNDWRQTIVIAKTPWRREKNKILGSQPHKDNVNIYFTGCLIGHALVAYILPEKLAELWQVTWVGIESNSIAGNVDNGHAEVVGMHYKLTHTVYF